MTGGDRPVRVGVVGGGFGRRVVAPVFSATEGCEVVEVVSARDRRQVDTLCARRDVDLVSVHSPPFLHVEHVEAALAAGRAVLCDKPFGCSSGDATRLVDAAGSREHPALLNFEFRYDPTRRALRDLVASGRLGSVEHVTWTHASAGSRVPLRPYGWLFDRDRGGGWLGAWGSHAVDTLRWMLGEVVHARGRLRTDIPVRPDAAGREHRCSAEDGFDAWLELAGDGRTTVTIDTTFAAAAPTAPRLVLHGTAATAECVGERRITVRAADGAEERLEPAAGGGDPHVAPMRLWAAVVRDAVRTGIVPDDAPTFVDGLACARVLDALRA